MNSRDDETLSQLIETFSGQTLARRRVRLLLGTDEHIALEARVALVPHQITALREALARCGIDLDVTVAAGAGARTRPPFTDAQYADVATEVLTVEDLTSSASGERRIEPFDVVHALKEPTDYEAFLPGRFLRLGALHLASRPPGVCRMLAERSFSAILDGATVGDFAHHQTGGDRTPIVGSMSRFAGAVAGRKVVESLTRRGLGGGRVVVVGGGIAGRSAIRAVRSVAEELWVIEPWAPMRERLAELLPSLGFEHFTIRESLEDEALEGAVGIVFAHRSGARAAEKVCNEAQIRTMRPGAAIADIAIDQGGSIAHDGYGEDDDATVAREKYLALFGDEYSYYAEVNMPREEPTQASETHGVAALPYLVALLGLVAVEGSAEAVTERLLARDVDRRADPEAARASSRLEAIEQDLRNGTQLVVRDGAVEIADPEVASHASLRQWVERCAEGS